MLTTVNIIKQALALNGAHILAKSRRQETQYISKLLEGLVDVVMSTQNPPLE